MTPKRVFTWEPKPTFKISSKSRFDAAMNASRFHIKAITNNGSVSNRVEIKQGFFFM